MPPPMTNRRAMPRGNGNPLLAWPKRPADCVEYARRLHRQFRKSRRLTPIRSMFLLSPHNVCPLLFLFGILYSVFLLLFPFFRAVAVLSTAVDDCEARQAKYRLSCQHGGRFRVADVEVDGCDGSET
jgi:hypothetical protein